MNRNYSLQFRAQHAKRQAYRKCVPVEFGFSECMDERGGISHACGLGIGTSETWRNPGAVFDPENSILFKRSLLDWSRVVLGQKRTPVFFSSSHFSASTKHLGCRAHNYNQLAGEGAVLSQAAQLQQMFLLRNGTAEVFALPCSFETDRGAIILRKTGSSSRLDAWKMRKLADDAIIRKVLEFYRSDVPSECVRIAIAKNLFLGNVERLRGLPSIEPSKPVDHAGNVIAYGRGSNWIPESMPHKALVIDYFDPRAEEHLRLAAEIVLENLVVRRSAPKKHGAALVVSAPYRLQSGGDPERNFAKEKARHFATKACGVIDRYVPELRPHLHVMVGVIENDTRRLELISRG